MSMQTIKEVVKEKYGEAAQRARTEKAMRLAIMT